MDKEHLLFGLASVIVLGIAAQWIAARLRLPSILLLLLAGILAGPVAGRVFGRALIDPDELFGPMLFPLIGLSVGVILFEGGLSLRLDELKRIGMPLRNLLTTGAVITWVLAALGAHYLLEMAWNVSLLMGAILTVTGPTVVGPMLRQIRPAGDAGRIAKWEGIVIDPIGAILAVLVFEASDAIQRDAYESATLSALVSLAVTCFVGIAIGAAISMILVQVIKRNWAPDYLDSPIVLMAVTTAFTVSNLLKEESGLISVTILGIVLANQKMQVLDTVMEFKERLTVLLVSILFMLMAARLDLRDLQDLGWRGMAFVALLILVVRPLAVAISTLGSELTWQERVFLAWMAPRGIVAASVASVFAMTMGEEAARLAPAMFLVIIGTVTVYGSTTGPLASWLGLATANPQGVLIAGASPVARAIAKALHESGFTVQLVDTNFANVQAARLEGLRAHFSSVLSESLLEEIDLWGIGRFMALTPNVEVNTLAAGRITGLFSRAEVYQLAPPATGRARLETAPHLLRGRILFDNEATWEQLRRRIERGDVIKRTKLTKEFSLGDYRQEYGNAALPLFVIRDSGRLSVVTPDKTLEAKAGHTIISLVEAGESSK